MNPFLTLYSGGSRKVDVKYQHFKETNGNIFGYNFLEGSSRKKKGVGMKAKTLLVHRLLNAFIFNANIKDRWIDCANIVNYIHKEHAL